MLQMRPLTPKFGVEITNIVLSSPDSKSKFNAILDAFNENAVLLFRNQSLKPADLIEWSHMFGRLEIHSDTAYLLENYPEILVIGNLIENGKMKSLFVNSAIEWHFDYAQAAEPALGAFLYAVEVPPVGGETLFVDARAAYDELSPEYKSRIKTRHAIFSYEYLDRHLRSMDPSRPPLSETMKEKWPPVKHPLVQPHPVTGRLALRLSPELMMQIEGLSSEESQKLISNLMDHATSDAFVYKHHWSKGDLIVMDNRSLIHTATPFNTDDYLRIMYRTTIMAESVE